MLEKELNKQNVHTEAMGADEARKEFVSLYDADIDQNKHFVKNSITGTSIYLVLHIIYRKICNRKNFS
jgi:hypothetical protein